MIKVLKNNCAYRVGDIFFAKGKRWKRDREEICTNPIYKGSILYRYLKLMRKEQDYECFCSEAKAITQANSYSVPREDELVLHLRLGDVFEPIEESRLLSNSKLDAREKMFKGDKLLNNYINFLDSFNFTGIQKITVVSAMHFGSNDENGKYFYTDQAAERSYTFLNRLKDRINNSGFDMHMVSNTNVDIDICYIMHSMHYVKSYSRFSRVIEPCLATGSKIYKVW